MARHFIAALGKGSYKDTTYHYGNFEHKSAYVQESLCNLIYENKQPGDKITILLTDEAKEENWLARNGYEDKPGLKEILKENFSHCDIKTQYIPTGANKEELDKIFDIVFGCIEEKDDIYFDTTHCLRHLPIFILSVLYYAKVLKDIKISSIYYGAFELKTEGEGDDSSRTPIFDLIEYIHMLDWSMAAQMFIKYGNANMMNDVYNEQKAKADNDTKRLIGPVGDVVKSLMHFTNCIQTSRGKNLDNKQKGKAKKSIYNAYKGFNNNYQEIKKQDAKVIKPLKSLFGKALDSTKEFDVTTNLGTGIATVQWCIDKGFTQQGLTALEETIKTYVCFKYSLDETTKGSREGIAKGALNLRNHNKGKKFEDADTSRVEEEHMEDVKRIYNAVSDEVVSISQKVSNARNDINHFGFKADPVKYNDLQKSLVESFNEFKEIIETEQINL